jgi:hypothetical protein
VGAGPGVFVTADDQLRSVPAGWTDVIAPDPFVVVAAGRSPLRVAELLALAALVEDLGSAPAPGV